MTQEKTMFSSYLNRWLKMNSKGLKYESREICWAAITENI